ncbi:hypothetical protein Q5P01_013109, partial [Channa striata]
FYLSLVQKLFNTSLASKQHFLAEKRRFASITLVLPWTFPTSPPLRGLRDPGPGLRLCTSAVGPRGPQDRGHSRTLTPRGRARRNMPQAYFQSFLSGFKLNKKADTVLFEDPAGSSGPYRRPLLRGLRDLPDVPSAAGSEGHLDLGSDSARLLWGLGDPRIEVILGP